MAGALVATALLGGCSGGASPGALAPVSALPAPKLPSWIAEVAPRKSAQSLSQIRVIFARPVATVGALEGGGPSALLAHFSIEPKLPGAFVLLTPRMVSFVPERALPIGTRVRVTLSAGLRDLDGDALGNDLSWTFDTGAITFKGLPSATPGPYSGGATPPPVSLLPTLRVTANAHVDAASLAAHATLQGDGESVALNAELEVQPTPFPGGGARAAFDASRRVWTYDLTPRQTLRKDVLYRLIVTPGVMPAYGNLASQRQFVGSLHTYGDLAIAAPPPPQVGRFAPSDPAIAFTNPLDAKTIAGNVTVSPAPASTTGIATVSQMLPNVVAIDPYALSPDTTYFVTIGTGVKDIYGQSLARPESAAFHTGSFAPGFWAPSGINVFPAGSGVALNFYATNLSGNRYRAYVMTPSPGQLASTGNDGFYDLIPQEKRWSSVAIAGAKRNVQSTIRIPVAARIGAATGALAYGVSARLYDTHRSTYGLVQLTNLGIFAQIFPEHALAWVQRLSDGAPVANARVSFYRLNPASSQPCATAITGVSGEASLRGSAMAACYVTGPNTFGSPGLMAVASLGADWTSAQVGGWNANIWQFDVDGTWVNGAPLSRGTIFSDRQMYQPGERAQMTGIAYYVQGDKLVADTGSTYRVTLIDPDGVKTALGAFKTDAYGAFAVSVPFAKNASLGYYTLAAKGASGNEIFGSVRVAEFKPPNFKLDLAFDKSVALAGSSVTVNAKAAYLFGAPLDGGKASIAVSRDVATLAPNGWDEYTFGRQWFWPDEPPSFDTDVLQDDGSFDAAGSYSRSVSVPADLPFPMTYSVDVQATDVSNLSVDTTQTFTALPSDGLIGLKTGFFGQAGKPLDVDVVVTDTTGKTIAGRRVHVELQTMTYASATQLQAGGEVPQNAVQYATVDATDVTPGGDAATVQLHPKGAGLYRIRANFTGARGDASETDLLAFVIGSGEADWGDQNPSAVSVTLDKKSYKVGDTATALVASPFERSDVYFMVIRHDVLWHTLVHATGNGPRVSFTVTPAMLPNAAVEAIVVRRGAPLREVKPGSLDSLSRVGLAPLRVDLGSRYLKVNVAPAKASLEPGARQEIGITVRDANGHAAQGEAVVMVVNDAILQLTGYRPPDLVKTVFASQPISTDFADSRQHVILQTQTAAVEKGWGYGGGFLAGAGSTRVRTNFAPLAYYRIVQTDASGRATASFALPDDLTTWRAMAVVIGRDDRHFGNGEATFVATKPLLTNAFLPLFARPGDRIDGGITALSPGGGGTLDVSGKLTGALQFADGERTAEQTDTLGSTMRAFAFPMIVGSPAPSTVAFTSRLGSRSDAFRVPLEIRDRAVTESSVESGVTAKNTSVPIDLSKGGTLTITLSNSAIAQVATPASDAMLADPFQFADDAAARLIVATATRGLAKRYDLHPQYDPQKQIAQALQTLATLQTSDGGFRIFAFAEGSDPFASADVADALAFSRAHGVATSGVNVRALRAYLARTLADPGKNAWCATAMCRARVRFEALWALAAMGDRRTDFLSSIVASSGTFDSATQIRLARYLLAVAQWRTRGIAMADALTSGVYRSGRYATANANDRWAWLGGAVNAQAQMLQLLLERGAGAEELDGAARALTAQSCGCGWPTIEDAAQAMVAISAYASRETLAPFTVAVTSGASRLGAATFGRTAKTVTLTLPASRARGASVDFAASGGGALHYVVLYTYRVADDAPGQLAGLRVIRTVEPAGETKPIVSMDLSALEAPVALSAGGVFDIGVRVIVDHAVNDVVIDDPIPAGMQAIDAAFRTSSTAVVAPTDSWSIADRQIYADRVTAYATHLEPGIYELHYLARTVTPGTYGWPGTRVYLRYAPEQFGRTAFASVTIR